MRPGASLRAMDIESVLRDALNGEPAVDMAILFGSYARGQARPGSDVDIGLRWTPGVTHATKNAVLDRIERCARATADAIDVDGAPPLLRMEIARSGKLLAARSPDAWPRFRARAMLDWWDFAPYARLMHEAARVRLEAAVRGAR
jgi:predicted nucleotidyltransferase